MPETLHAVLALLTWVAGPGAGYAGSLLFDQLRAWLPPERCPSWLARTLWDAETATYTAPALAALLGALAHVGAAVLQAVITGGSLPAALDTGVATALSALAAAWMSQQRHRARGRTASARFDRPRIPRTEGERGE